MSKYWRAPVGTVFGVVIAAGLLCAVVSAADDEKEATIKAGQAVLKLADVVEKGDADAIKKGAAELAKGNELSAVMNGFGKPNGDLPGIGFGPKTNAQVGIEAQIMTLTKKPLTADVAKKQGEDIRRAAIIAATIAEVTALKPPGNAKDAAKWAGYTKEMSAAAKALADAGKAADPTAIITGAKKLTKACNDCHTTFR